MTSHCLEAKEYATVSRTFSFMAFLSQNIYQMKFILICGSRMEITVLYCKLGLRNLILLSQISVYLSPLRVAR